MSVIFLLRQITRQAFEKRCYRWVGLCTASSLADAAGSLGAVRCKVATREAYCRGSGKLKFSWVFSRL